MLILLIHVHIMLWMSLDLKRFVHIVTDFGGEVV